MKLRPFQQLAVEKMVHFLKTNPEHGCYNATEQGLGKTIETIKTLDELKLRTVLVVCPAIMKHTWAREILTWTDGDPCEINMIEKVKEDFPNTHFPSKWVVVSYTLAAKTDCLEKLLAIKFDALVLDEAHYVKTPRAQRTKAILGRLWPKIPYRISLSGTPATQSIADLYTTFHRLNPGAFPDFRTFTERYTNPKWNGFQTVYEGIKNEKELSKIMRETFYLRDTKEEVAKDLPPKNWCPIVLPNSYCISHDETEYEKEQHKLYVKQLQGALAKGLPAKPPPKAIATKRKEQALKMVPAVIEFTKELLSQGLPVVVFAHHREVIWQLQNKLGNNILSLTGESSSTERNWALTEFQNGANPCIIVSMQAGGVGIDLTCASNAVFAEWDYNPSTISQSASRLHRLTQTLPCNYYYFTIDHGWDEGIFELCIKKSETFAKII